MHVPGIVEGIEIRKTRKEETTMASFISQIFPSRSSTSIRVPSSKIYNVEDAVEKPARTLKHLLKLNHAEHALHTNASSSEFFTSYNSVDHVWSFLNLFLSNQVPANGMARSF